MSKTGQRDELNLVEEFEDDSGTAPTVSGKISAFLERTELQDTQPIFYLYRYENYDSGETKAFIQKYEDCEEIPDEESIARRYGHGRYMLTMTIPASKGGKRGLTRWYKFRVHPLFKRGDDMFQQQSSMQPVHIHQKQQNSMSEVFSMMERFVAMLVPLLNRPRDENVLGILNQSYESINEVMKKQMLNNMALLNDYQRNVAELGEVQPVFTDEKEEEAPSIMEQFGPIIQQWLPLLMGNGPQAQAAGAIARTVPQVQSIMRDKLQLKKIINYLDQTNGPDTTDRILNALKIKRIGNRPVVLQQPPTPSVSAAPPRRKVVRKKVADTK